MSGLNRTPGKRVYVSKRTAGSNPALSAKTKFPQIFHRSKNRGKWLKYKEK